jgi:hypothetical protein
MDEQKLVNPNAAAPSIPGGLQPGAYVMDKVYFEMNFQERTWRHYKTVELVLPVEPCAEMPGLRYV